MRPYVASVPSFGEWGFALAAPRQLPIPAEVPPGCRFLTPELLPTLFVLPEDARPEPDHVPEVNRLSTQVLVRLYGQEVSR